MTFVIHCLAKEYGYSKSQINELYPEEVIVLLRFISSDKLDESLKQKIEYNLSCIDKVNIQYGDAEKIRQQFVSKLESLQQTNIDVNQDDDDLPDFKTWNKLKDFKQKHANK